MLLSLHLSLLISPEACDLNTFQTNLMDLVPTFYYHKVTGPFS